MAATLALSPVRTVWAAWFQMSLIQSAPAKRTQSRSPSG